MDERQLLIEELADGHRMVGAALSDLSSEVAEWQPGGTANSIASLLAHTIVGEDRVVNQMFGAGELLFQSGDWAAKTGIPAENSEIWQPGWVSKSRSVRCLPRGSAAEHGRLAGGPRPGDTRR